MARPVRLFDRWPHLLGSPLRCSGVLRDYVACWTFFNLAHVRSCQAN